MKSGYEDLKFAKVDTHRMVRKGFPEVIYGQGKTPEQVTKIAKSLIAKGQNVLVTRADKITFKHLKPFLKNAQYHETARIITIRLKTEKRKKSEGIIAIVTAGTADVPIAEEAAVTAEFLGNQVERIYDVGVAGIHRLFDNLGKIKKAKVVIAVAGMEGALPSALAGLVNKPVIAVPTSVGYGANFKGLSALLTMMNSCAPGVAVVNIDNGFGAAVVAHYILKT